MDSCETGSLLDRTEAAYPPKKYPTMSADDVVQVDRAGSIHIASVLIERWEADCEGRVAARLVEACATSDGLVIDLTQVRFMDSTGLGELVRVVKRVRCQARAVSVCGLNSQVGAVLNLMQLADWLAVEPTVARAIQRCGEEDGGGS